MKFFHLADLHFGKAVHDVQMVSEDQPYWVEQLLYAVDEREPDAVVIAGDIYDTRNPSVEAIKLFDYFVTQLAKRALYVFIIPGNHDSNIRLSFGSELLKYNKIYIAGELTKEIQSVPVNIDGVKVNFWLLPYIYPTLVESDKVLNCQGLATYDTAMRALLKEQTVHKEEINVLVAHQNVLAGSKKPEHSDSEAIVGGLGEIDYTAFDGFDYVALGHIHNAQAMGRDTVVYAGCPLYYDFSECDRWKGITEIIINNKQSILINKFEIPVLHKMLRLTGSVQEIIKQSKKLENIRDFYIQAVITDHDYSSEDYNAMKYYLGDSLMNIDFKLAGDRLELGKEEELHTDVEKLNLEDNLTEFLVAVKEEPLDERQKELVRYIMEQQQASTKSDLKDVGQVPEQEVEQLLAFVLEE